MKIDTAHLTDILDHAREIVYVIDIETYELLYANERAREWKGNRVLEGQPCYQAMNRLEERCPWCFIPRMVDGEIHFDEAHVPGTGMWLQIDAYEVDWHGRRAAFIYSIDITKQKQRERMLENGFAEAKLVVWTYEIAEHRVIMSDYEFTRLDYVKFGIEQVIENAPQSLVPSIADDDVEAFLDIYRRIDEGEPKASCEVWYKLKPGQEPRCMRITLTNEFDADGKPVRALGLGQNITAQKNAELRYEQAYHDLARAYPHSLGTFHLNLTKNWCGEGKSPLDFVLKQQESGTVDGYFKEFSKLIADDSVKAWFFENFEREKLVKEFEQGRSEVSFEYPIIYEDGVRHWREGLLFMMQNPITGDVEGVTYAIDIDERKRDERIIELIEGKNSEYIGLIYAQTREFEFLRKVEEISYSEIGQKVDYDAYCIYVKNGLITDEERQEFDASTNLESIVAGLKKAGRYSSSYRRQEDGAVRCEQLSYNWFDESGGVILAVRTDVTTAYALEQQRIAELGERTAEIEKLNASLKEALDKAEQATAAEQTFLSSMSHDMRTPLSGIIGFTDLALKTGDAGKKQSYLEKIEASSSLMLDLVNDVLDMSKIESGKLDLHLQAVESREIFDTIVESVRLSAEKRGISLLAELDQGYPRFVMIDRLRVQQISLNLLSNAIKYTPDNGTVSFEVRRLGKDDGGDMPADDGCFKCKDSNCNTLIRVSDNGIGMSKVFQVRMFEPFSQEHQSRMFGTQGTGLGLSIVKRVVDLMGGHIEVESDLGKGSTFSVYLPIDAIAIGQAAAGEQHRAVASIAGMRILLCEDNSLNAEIAETILRERGKADSELANNGKAGLEMFEVSAPGYYDAVLMDLRMPVMDGIETSKAIRSLDRPDAKKIPIIAMTADAFEEDVQRCLDAGMDAHISKPINPDKLIETLGEYRLRS